MANLDTTDPAALQNIIRQMQADIAELKTRPVVFGEAGEAMEENDLPVIVKDSSGQVRGIMSAKNLYEDFGVNAFLLGRDPSGVPTFWVDFDTGILNVTQVNFNGLTLLGSLVQLLQLGSILSQTATANGKTRQMKAGLIDNGSYPEFRIEFNEPGSTPITVPNGDFATNDMTNWTQTAGTWDALLGYANCVSEVNNVNVAVGIKSSRFAITAGNKFTFSAKSYAGFRAFYMGIGTGTITIQADFYDASSGGSLISSVTAISRTGSSPFAWAAFAKDIVVPAGASYVEFVVTVTPGSGCSVSACGFDDFSVVPVSHTSFLAFRDNGLFYTSFGGTETTLVSYESVDAYVKALLHFNGTDASTTFTDGSGKTWTANGNAQIDTAQSKFGGASGLFDGSGDWIDTPDNADFDLGSGDFTIDFWMRPAALNQTCYVAGQSASTGANADMSFSVQLSVTEQVLVAVYSGSSQKLITSSSGKYASNVWMHVAIVRSASVMTLYLDGVASGTVSLTGITVNNSAYKVAIGRLGEYTASGNTFNGWIDEFRFSKGIARWTTGFTPPVAEY